MLIEADMDPDAPEVGCRRYPEVDDLHYVDEPLAPGVERDPDELIVEQLGVAWPRIRRGVTEQIVIVDGVSKSHAMTRSARLLVDAALLTRRVVALARLPAEAPARSAQVGRRR